MIGSRYFGLDFFAWLMLAWKVLVLKRLKSLELRHRTRLTHQRLELEPLEQLETTGELGDERLDLQEGWQRAEQTYDKLRRAGQDLEEGWRQVGRTLSVLERREQERREQRNRLMGRVRSDWQRMTIRIVRLFSVSALSGSAIKGQGEDWAILLGRLIPSKYRNAIVGDVLEDCGVMRDAGRTERHITIRVLWQCLTAAITVRVERVRSFAKDVVKGAKGPSE